jgi:aminoglycoside phosphotransferase family enzyme
MTAHPSFVVEDQSDVIAALEKRLAPAKRIDTHGAVVFLSGNRAYKLKRAVKFPYMDFSTAERRRAMCEAEVYINRRLAPEIYLGVEPVENDWVVVMRRFDEDGLLDRMAERGQLTSELMASLGNRIAR